MLTKTEVEMLEQLLENDRLQKQLLQELFISLLDDERGISQDSYSILCELGDACEYIFDGLEQVGSTEDRVYLKEREKLNTFMFDVAYEYTLEACWDWADKQTIATIEDICFIPTHKKDTTRTAGKIQIIFQFEGQNTIDARIKLVDDFKINAVAGK